MKTARLVTLVFATTMAVGLTIVSLALAEPEFNPIGGSFTGTSGTSTIAGGGQSVRCTSDTSRGTISSATLAGGVKVEFSGCASTGTGGANCAAKSTNSPSSGVIVTNTLHGVLGLILPKGNGEEVVGLLLLPVVNKKFFTIETNTCTVETTVSGNVAGQLTPTKESTLTGTLTFQKAAAGGGESIKDFDLSTGGLVRPELEAWGALASFESTEALKFTPAIEIT